MQVPRQKASAPWVRQGQELFCSTTVWLIQTTALTPPNKEEKPSLEYRFWYDTNNLLLKISVIRAMSSNWQINYLHWHFYCSRRHYPVLFCCRLLNSNSKQQLWNPVYISQEQNISMYLIGRNWELPLSGHILSSFLSLVTNISTLSDLTHCRLIFLPLTQGTVCPSVLTLCLGSSLHIRMKNQEEK